MLTARPLTTRLMRRLTARAEGLQAAAVETVELSPPAPVHYDPAIALPDEWARVKGCAPGSPFAWEEGIVRGGSHTQPATLSYCVRDALWIDGAVFAGRHMEQFAPRRTPLIVAAKGEYLPCAQLCLTSVSSRYFAHWLIDQLSLELLAEERGMPALTRATPGWTHEAGYRAMARLHPHMPWIARIDRLWIVDDRHLNPSRASRLETLRTRLRKPGSGGGSRVYIDRGVTGKARTLCNRDVVVEALASRGFAILYPERESPEQISEILSNAEICVGIEGSALSHAIALLPRAATIVALEPPRRFTGLMKTYADMVGIRFAYVVGDDEGEAFSIDVSRLLATLALVAA